MSLTYTYNKTEKIKSKKQLDALFTKGKSFLVFPLKVVYCFNALNDESIINVGVGVSKKNFARATDRNRIKRLMRESYRLNKLSLHETIIKKKLDFFILYIDKKKPEKRMDIDTKMIKALDKLSKFYADEQAV